MAIDRAVLMPSRELGLAEEEDASRRGGARMVEVEVEADKKFDRSGSGRGKNMRPPEANGAGTDIALLV